MAAPEADDGSSAVIEAKSFRVVQWRRARIVAAQNALPIARIWESGKVASADGIRFVAPSSAIHAGANPKYFGAGRGITYYNLISDQFTGLNAVVVPGTLRDGLLAGTVAAHAAQTGMGHDTMGHDSMGHGANASNQIPAATAGATTPADVVSGANGAALVTKNGGR
jgi:hypothetical protein